ncbi:CPBP family intramembrane glutamic endopeptidase [Glycomyces harbinensis]|uniref:CAAX prenyl protease 2/Lysostaphin resistance protein A-like domain-containing protein n=1 Tax=Glycomyces harbinensis TaxID=58114 RepID=A0A1G6XDF6_9ACTN|nr:type II CAAX endopeptidase family protein [Glycomyces harbinensis]SDD76274.1 hypothetical protein SAMN05216270_107116 [Glycomyces harbinensis]
MTVDSREATLTERTRPAAPGWPEILAGTAVYVVSLVLVALLLPRIESDAATGVVGLLVSGVIGLLAFALAVRLRIRDLAVFGVRRARPRHLLVGATLGLGAYVLGTIASLIYIVLSGDTENIQTSYQAAAAGGWWYLALALAAGAVLTPLGEEAFFRGVVANALLHRYRAWIAVVASAAFFALAHGVNPILPVAFVVGVLTALLLRWSGSIWPGVLLHGVNNAIALLVPVLIGLGTE